ncbi:hypothetical protein J6590_035502 [Homalodisca vitripennis]|nr:hypothetical protein J6590_035502 [Homalodisca vitripennis]
MEIVHVLRPGRIRRVRVDPDKETTRPSFGSNIIARLQFPTNDPNMNPHDSAAPPGVVSAPSIDHRHLGPEGPVGPRRSGLGPEAEGGASRAGARTEGKLGWVSQSGDFINFRKASPLKKGQLQATSRVLERQGIRNTKSIFTVTVIYR